VAKEAADLVAAGKPRDTQEEGVILASFLYYKI
jgi:hypothetical protein